MGLFVASSYWEHLTEAITFDPIEVQILYFAWN